MIDTRTQFQLQIGVFLKRPDVVTFDVSEKVNNNILTSIQNKASVLLTDKSQEVPNYFVV